MQEYEKKHLSMVRRSASECTLFLKRDDKQGSFPLQHAGEIAVYGAGVRHTVKGGTGSGEVNSRFSVNIEKGLEKAGFRITTKDWLDSYDAELQRAKDAFIKQIQREAKEKHVNILIYCMGKTQPSPEYEILIAKRGTTAVYVVSRDSGEGADREPRKGDILLTDSEIRDIRLLNELYENFMLVLNVGGVIDLSPVMEVKNILLLSQLGVVTGDVFADILLGKANPCGKLTTTWAKWEDYYPDMEFGDPDDTRYKEGIYVGYRYFDSLCKEPLFRFGYGQSYTSFRMGQWSVLCPKVGHNTEPRLKIYVTVENTGPFAGKEVVQVYVSAPAGKLDKPYQELQAYAKTSLLKPGETEEVTLSFRVADLASYDTKAEAYILEAGDYTIRVGNSSADTTPIAILRLEKPVVVKKTRNCLGYTNFRDFVPTKAESEEVLSNQEMKETPEVILLDPEDFETEVVAYDPEYEIDNRAKNLTEEELAYIGIGGFNPNGGVLSIIGDAASHVAGAAGETTSVLENKGIKPLVMSDGPAGLRLARQHYIDEKGAHAVGTSVFPESMEAFLSGPLKTAVKMLGGKKDAPKNAVIHHQYATAIPIGTAVAQSFNTELAEKLGDLVGNEMERFGVHLWLAPALNIHRSIRCGRNFEYYSEDPYVSGTMAAAITNGVQKHPGRGTTIKHYAANNQEFQRYTNNSWVSERTMREIYLKGFGICVKLSQPRTVMTSYNLLNCTHTAEHKGLIEDVLRCEYGFKGVVMTDWVIRMAADKHAKFRNSLSDHVSAAGGDLFMPGCRKDYQTLLASIRKSPEKKIQAQINASRVIRLVDQLTKKD